MPPHYPTKDGLPSDRWGMLAERIWMRGLAPKMRDSGCEGLVVTSIH